MDHISTVAADQTAILNGFGFIEFVQIFLFGDFHLMMSFIPNVVFGLGIFDEIEYNEQLVNQTTLDGEPLKNAMFIQTMRQLPILLSTPIIYLVGLSSINFFLLCKLVLQYIDTAINGGTSLTDISRMEPSRSTPSELPLDLEETSLDVVKTVDVINWRDMRSDLKHEPTLKANDRLVSSLGSICIKLLSLVVNDWHSIKENGYLKDNEGNKVHLGERQGNIALAPSILELAGDLDRHLGALRKNLLDTLPNVGICFGEVVGLLFRYAVWVQFGKPFGPFFLCAGLTGISIKQFLDGLRTLE